MHPLNAFRDLTEAGSRLGFFTGATRNEIPARPGCYGWFLPLWIVRDTLPEFLSLFGNVMTHEPKPPEELKAGFKWDAVRVRLRREFDPAINEKKWVPLWERLYENEQARHLFQQVLLQASVLTPPLYVGTAENLRRRYNQHTMRPHPGDNNFHSRFQEYSDRFGLGITVDDLIFVCIRTDDPEDSTLPSLAKGKDADDVHKLLEEILKRLCRPPFSMR